MSENWLFLPRLHLHLILFGLYSHLSLSLLQKADSPMCFHSSLSFPKIPWGVTVNADICDTLHGRHTLKKWAEVCACVCVSVSECVLFFSLCLCAWVRALPWARSLKCICMTEHPCFWMQNDVFPTPHVHACASVYDSMCIRICAYVWV